MSSYVKSSDKLITAGKIDDAIVNYQHAIKAYPREPVLYINQAVLFKNQKKYTHAIRNYSTILKLNPNSHWGYIGLSRVYLLQKKFDKAKMILQQGELALSKNPSLVFHLGLVSYEMGLAEDALGYFDKVLDMGYSQVHKAYLYRGMTFELLLKNKKRAKLDYESYLKLEHDDDKQAVKKRLEKLRPDHYEF